MSSSKVFKEDRLFTPTSLVRQTIAVPRDAKIPADIQPQVAATDPGSASLPASAPDPAELTPTSDSERVSEIDLEVLCQEAYQQGVTDGLAQQQEILAPVLTAFTQGCQNLVNLRQTLWDNSRAELINLTILLCEKILRQELATARNVIATTLQAALERAIESEEYYVTLHPDDLELAQAQEPELIAAVRGLNRLVFKTDPSLTRGGCLLESTVGTVDATIPAQLASLREFLAEQPLLIAANESQEPAPAAAPFPQTMTES